jgi:hypothetical protein
MPGGLSRFALRILVDQRLEGARRLVLFALQCVRVPDTEQKRGLVRAGGHFLQASSEKVERLFRFFELEV